MPYDETTSETMRCTYRCEKLEDSDKKYSCKKGSMKVLTKTEDIQREIMENGSMIATFAVYDDFYAYDGGVYKHHVGEFSVNHAARIIGWGTDGSGKLYWQSLNQWSTAWGENSG